MNLLPRFSSEVRSLAISIFRFLLLILFLLITYHFLLITGSVYADPGPPNPKSCQDSVSTDKLTDNWITDGNRNPPIDQTLSRTGTPGQAVTVALDTSFTIDFSKLQAIFGIPNSNYLEGRFQDQLHQSANIISLNSSEFNKYHGPGQKAAPKVMTDQLRVKYVQYIYEHPQLPEASSKYADIEGKNPHTIYELIHDLGFLYPPVPPESDDDKTQWLATWGRYWEKIPTTYSEFYEGKIEFRFLAGKDLIDQAKAGNYCPQDNLRVIKFVMPEFFRTTATSGQLNQVIVPKVAQSPENNLILVAAKNTHMAVAQFLQKCLKTATDNPFSQTLRKIIKVSLNTLNPLKVAFAAQDTSCIKILDQGKQGSAPYCALPAGQLQPGDSCTNIDDPNKLDKDNPNVICTFKLIWTSPQPLIIGQTGPGQWDRCDPPDPDTGEQTCYLEVAIWPVIRIPWLSEIWNNTLYSDEEEGQSGFGVGSQQETGRPGIYAFFTPRSVAGSDSLDEVLKKIQECFDAGKSVLECQKIAYNYKGLPGEIQTGVDLKERFIGGTDCNKEFVRDLALKPKALQEALSVKAGCQAGP